MIEHAEARAEGVYLTWIFRHAMAADKPLTLILAVDGAAYAGETTRGHHFSGEDGIARVRVGRAEAVDRAGRRFIRFSPHFYNTDAELDRAVGLM